MSEIEKTPRGQKRTNDEPHATASAKRYQRGGLSQQKLDEFLLKSNNQFAPLITAPEDVSTDTSSSKTLKHQPPIKITQPLTNPKETKKEIRKWVTGTIHFQLNKHGSEILTYSVNDHKIIQAKLKENNIQFYTFTPRSEVPKKLVLKGVDAGCFTTDDILTDLKGQLSDHGITVTKVTQLMDKDGRSTVTNPCLVYFDSNTNVNFVTRAVKYCCDHRIKWDHFRTPRKNSGTQCHNCQRMGHVAKNCGLPYRCVKCTTQHLPGQCKKLSTDKPVCVNCSKHHTSNWRGCEVIKTYRESKVKDKRLGNSPTGAPQHSHTRTSTAALPRSDKQTKSYSNVIKQSTSKSNQSASLGEPVNVNVNKPGNSKKPNNFNTFNFLETEVNNLFNLNLSELILKMREFIPQYQSVKETSDKQLVLLSFLFSVLK